MRTIPDFIKRHRILYQSTSGIKMNYRKILGREYINKGVYYIPKQKHICSDDSVFTNISTHMLSLQLRKKLNETIRRVGKTCTRIW